MFISVRGKTDFTEPKFSETAAKRRSRISKFQAQHFTPSPTTSRIDDRRPLAMDTLPDKYRWFDFVIITLMFSAKHAN